MLRPNNNLGKEEINAIKMRLGYRGGGYDIEKNINTDLFDLKSSRAWSTRS